MMGIGIGIDYVLLMVTRFREWRAAGLDPRGRHRRHPGHRRPLRAGRRQHRRDQHARPVRDGPVVHARRRPGHDPRRARGDGRERHAVPGAARLPRPARRPAAAAARPPRRDPGRRRWPRRAVPRLAAAGAGWSSGTAWWPPLPGWPAPARARRAVPGRALRVPRRRQQPRGHLDPAGLRPAGRRLRSRRQRPAADGRRAARARRRGRRGQLDDATSRLRSTSGVAAVTARQLNPAGDTAVVTVVPTTGPQDPRTEDLVHRLRDTTLPAAVEGTGADRPRRRRDRHLDRQHRRTSPGASRC